VILAKVDLLYSSHALRKRGLFENVEIDMVTKPKIGARVKWTGQVATDYGTITHVCGKKFEVKWDTPDPDSGCDTFSYGVDEPQSGVRFA
jgi:hypothetical protein